jgi:hypothetical protein
VDFPILRSFRTTTTSSFSLGRVLRTFPHHHASREAPETICACLRSANGFSSQVLNQLIKATIPNCYIADKIRTVDNFYPPDRFA